MDQLSVCNGQLSVISGDWLVFSYQWEASVEFGFQNATDNCPLLTDN